MVSASQITNPLGATVVFDGANPRIYTAKATVAISGGYLVQTSGATGDVGSGISSYVAGDIKVIGAQNIRLCNGIALNNAGSNELVSVATRGAYLMQASDIVSGGAQVAHNASGAVGNWTPLLASGTVLYDVMGPTPIGRALTTSASGTANYALIALNL